MHDSTEVRDEIQFTESDTIETDVLENNGEWQQLRQTSSGIYSFSRNTDGSVTSFDQRTFFPLPDSTGSWSVEVDGVSVIVEDLEVNEDGGLSYKIGTAHVTEHPSGFKVVVQDDQQYLFDSSGNLIEHSEFVPATIAATEHPQSHGPSAEQGNDGAKPDERLQSTADVNAGQGRLDNKPRSNVTEGAADLKDIQQGPVSIPFLSARILSEPDRERARGLLRDLSSSVEATRTNALEGLSAMGPGILPELSPLIAGAGNNESLLQLIRTAFDRASGGQILSLESRMQVAPANESPAERAARIEALVSEADLMASNARARATRLANVSYLAGIGNSLDGISAAAASVTAELENPASLRAVVRILAAESLLNSNGELEPASGHAPHIVRARQLVLEALQNNREIVADRRLTALLVRSSMLEDAEVRRAFGQAGGDIREITQLQQAPAATVTDRASAGMNAAFFPHAGNSRNLTAAERMTNFNAPATSGMERVRLMTDHYLAALALPEGQARTAQILQARTELARVQNTAELQGTDGAAAAVAARDSLSHFDVFEMANSAAGRLQPWRNGLRENAGELNQLLQLAPVERQAGNHRVLQILLQRFDAATNNDERQSVFNVLRSEVQRGNLSAITPLRALITIDASTRLVDSTRLLSEANGNPATEARARDLQRQALLDLARLADAERRMNQPSQAGEILDHLTRRPLDGINPLQVSQARLAASRDAEQRHARVMEIMRTAVSASASSSERATALQALNQLRLNEIAGTGAGQRTSPLLEIASYANSLRGITSDAPVAEVARRLAATSLESAQARNFLQSLENGGAGGRAVAQAIRSRNTEQIEAALSRPAARRAFDTALGAEHRRLSMLAALRAVDVEKVAGGRGNLEQLFEEARRQRLETNRRFDDAVDTYLLRDNAGLQSRQLVAGLLPAPSRDLNAADIQAPQLQSIRNGLRLGHFDGRSSELLRLLLEPPPQGKLSAAQVSELSTLLQRPPHARRQNALDEMRRLSGENLHLTGQYESQLNRMQSLNAVRTIHANINSAETILNSRDSQTTEKRQALATLIASLEALQRQATDGSHHPDSIDYLRSFAQRPGNNNQSFARTLDTLRSALQENSFESAGPVLARLKLLPNGSQQENEFRALRIVRDLVPQSSEHDVANALGRLNEEIENSRREGGINQNAVEWRTWLVANEAVMRLSRLSAAGDAAGARSAVQTLVTEARADNQHARTALAAILIANTGEQAAVGHWLANNQRVNNRPVYVPNFEGLTQGIRRELAVTASNALKDIYGWGEVPQAISSAVATSFALESQGTNPLRSSLREFIDQASRTSRDSMMNGIMAAISLERGNTADLADFYLKGIDSTNIANHFDDIERAARNGDRASLRIIAALTTGAGDNNTQLNPRIHGSDQERNPISRRARTILESIAQNPDRRAALVESLLHVSELRTADNRFSDSRQYLATLGTVAAMLPNNQLTDRIRRELRSGYERASDALRAAPTSARAMETARSATEGFFAIAARWNAADARIITPERVNPELLTLLRQQSRRISNEAATQIIERFRSALNAPAAEGETAAVVLQRRLNAVRILSALADRLSVEDVRTIAAFGTTRRHNENRPADKPTDRPFVGPPAPTPRTGDDLLTDLRITEPGAREQFRAECSVALLQVLARGRSVLPDAPDGPRELAFRSFQTNPWPIFANGISGDIIPSSGANNSAALRDALVSYCRGVQEFRPEIAERVNLIVDNARIPRPAAAILMEYGVPRGTVGEARNPFDPPNVFDITAAITRNYSVNGKDGEQVMRDVLRNAEMLNALPGELRAQLMGWTTLSNERKQQLPGWFSEPAANVRAAIGWDRMSEIERERMRWQNVKLDPRTIIGQMYGNALQTSANAVLLQDIPERIGALHSAAASERDELNSRISRLQHRREENLNQLVTMTRAGVSLGTRIWNIGNNGVAPDFDERQGTLARSFDQIRTEIAAVAPRANSARARVDGLQMANELATYIERRNQGDMVAARQQALNLFETHGILLSQLNGRIWRDLAISNDNTVVGASLYAQMHQRQQTHWNEIPAYGRPPAQASEEERTRINRQAFRQILGLDRLPGQEEARGLMQIRSEARLQDRPALLNHMMRALNDDPILNEAQGVASSMRERMQEFQSFLAAARDGHVFGGGMNALRENARTLDAILSPTDPQERQRRERLLENLRERIGLIREAYNQATREGSGTSAESVSRLLDTLKTYEQMHDMLNPNQDRNFDKRSVMQTREVVSFAGGRRIVTHEETDRPVLDEAGRQTPRNPYGDLRRAINDVLQGRVTESTATNWAKENAATIGATIAACALTVAACATFGVTSAFAVAAWVAVAGLATRETVNEIFYHVNHERHTGWGPTSNNGSRIGHFIRAAENPNQTLTSEERWHMFTNHVALPYSGELFRDWLAFVVTAGMSNYVFGGKDATIGSAIRSTWKATPDSLQQVALNAERLALLQNGSSPTSAFVRQLLHHGWNEMRTNAWFTAAQMGLEAGVQAGAEGLTGRNWTPQQMAKFGEWGNWIFSLGNSTVLAMGHGWRSGRANQRLIENARFGQGNVMEFRLAPGATEAQYVQFMREQGYHVQSAPGRDGMWLIRPIGASSDLPPVLVRNAARGDGTPAVEMPAGLRTELLATSMGSEVTVAGESRTLPREGRVVVERVRAFSEHMFAGRYEQALNVAMDRTAVPINTPISTREVVLKLSDLPASGPERTRVLQQFLQGIGRSGEAPIGTAPNQTARIPQAIIEVSGVKFDLVRGTIVDAGGHAPNSQQVQAAQRQFSEFRDSAHGRNAIYETLVTVMEETTHLRMNALGNQAISPSFARFVNETQAGSREHTDAFTREGGQRRSRWSIEQEMLFVFRDAGWTPEMLQHFFGHNHVDIRAQAFQHLSGQPVAPDYRALYFQYHQLNAQEAFQSLNREQRRAVQTAIEREYQNPAAPAEQRARNARLHSLVEYLNDPVLKSLAERSPAVREQIDATVERIRSGRYMSVEAVPQMNVTIDANTSARVVSIHGEDLPLHFSSGFFYPGNSPGATTSPMKVHVETSGPQDLHRLQAVLIPLLQNHPVLKELVGIWKTIDPASGAGLEHHPQAQVPNGTRQGGKGFTIYCGDPAHVRLVQRIISEALQQHGLGLETRINTGNADRVDLLTNRVGVARDCWPATSNGLTGADSRAGFLLDAHISNELNRQLGLQPHQRMTEAQLRQVEQRLNLTANLLEYDFTGRLMLRTLSPDPYNGGFYATEARPGANGALSERKALYELYRHCGIVDPSEALIRRPDRITARLGERTISSHPGQEFTVGRQNDESTFISRSHLSVRVDNQGAVFIKDLASRNGTFVNGTRIAANEYVRINPGDIVTMGAPENVLHISALFAR